jgi:hypothetical protein
VRYFTVTQDATFRIDVTPGVYTVTLTMGDATVAHDQDIYFNYHKVDSVVTQAGVPLTKTYTVDVYDGHLRVEVYGASGSDQYATLHSLTYQLTSTPLPPLPYSQRYDFGQALLNGYVNQPAPPAEGYTQVTKDTAYTPGGYGWVSGTNLDDRDQSFNSDYFVSNPLTRSLDLANDATFKATVPNGTYNVTLIFGDLGSPHDQTMYLQGASVGTVLVNPADYQFLTYPVTVTDGTFTFRMVQADPNINYALINGIDIVSTNVTVPNPPVSPPTPAPGPITATLGNGGAVNEGSTGTVSFSNVTGGSGGYTYSFDFGNTGKFEVTNSSSPTAVVPSSFLADGPAGLVVRGVVTDNKGAQASYTTTIQVNNVAPTAAITSASANAAGNTFAFAGTGSDPSAADQASLQFAWDFGDGGAGAGQSASHSYAAPGTYAVRLTVTDKDGGVGTASTSVTVTAPPTPTPTPSNALRLDFGTATSATASGFTKVTESTVYSAATGYGWAAAVDSRDRGTSDPLGAAFDLGVKPTFLVDLAPGTYDVRLTSGDPSAAHDMTVSLNGTQVDSIATASGQYAQKTYTVTVGADGRLTVALDGTNGTDPYAVLNGLEVAPTGQLPAPTVPQPNPASVPGPNAPPTTPTPSAPPISTRPTAGYIVTPAGYIPDFGANPTIVSARSGNWSDPGTWAQGHVPGAGDVVSIASGTTVSYDVVSTSPVDTVVVQANGHLVFRTDINTTLSVTNLLVLEQGELQVGTAANPVAANVKAQIIFNDLPIDTTKDPEQFGHGLIGLGKVTMYGASKGASFLRLAAEPLAGATTITLSQPAPGWAVGDRLLLPDTRQLDPDTKPGGASWDPTGQFEFATISAISADGLTITLSAPLQYDHLGARTAAGVLDILPHVANMTRNVIVRSANARGTRGHVLFTGKADVDIHNTAFSGLGRTRIDAYDNTTFDSNWNVSHVGTNQADREAVVFYHVVGPAGGQADGFQYTFDGNVVMCPIMPMPFRWGIAIEDSHYGSIQNNVAFNWAGAGIITVKGGETGNVIADNFITHVRGADVNPGRPDNRGYVDVGVEGVGLWMRGYSNFVHDNVVNDSPIAYLYFPDDSNQLHPTPAFQGADTNDPSQAVMVDSFHVPIKQFASNEAYGGDMAQALSMWHLDTVGSASVPNAPQSVVKDFKAWNVYDKLYYNYMTTGLTFDGLVARGDVSKIARWGSGPLALYGGGDYVQEAFTVENSDIQGFYIGIQPSSFGHQTIKDTYLQNYMDVVMTTRWCLDLNAPMAQDPRITDINDVRFAGLNIGTVGDYAPALISMQGWLIADKTTLTALDQVNVTQFNGVAGDDFRVYFNEQAADHVLQQTLLDPSQPLDVLGSPVAGLTNAQAWAQYGVAFAGAVAPSTATTRAGIVGLVSPE